MQQMKQPLRQSYPRDILLQLFWVATYLGVEPSLNRDILEQVCRNFFPIEKP
jgi:hypothetical protein